MFRWILLRRINHKHRKPHKNSQQGGGSSYTAKRRPVRLVYNEEFSSLDAAVKRERQIKKWSRAKKEALIFGEKKMLKKLSKSY
jgi:putative endonuclease